MKELAWLLPNVNSIENRKGEHCSRYRTLKGCDNDMQSMTLACILTWKKIATMEVLEIWTGD